MNKLDLYEATAIIVGIVSIILVFDAPQSYVIVGMWGFINGRFRGLRG